MWPFENKKQKQIDSLEEKIRDITQSIYKDTRNKVICIECGFVKERQQFTNSMNRYYLNEEKAVCNDCQPKVEKREEAVKYATESPLTVLDCKKDNE